MASQFGEISIRGQKVDGSRLAPKGPARERAHWRAWVLGGSLLLAALGAIGGGALLPALVTLIGLICAPVERLGRLIRDNAVLIALTAAFVIWVGISALWSPYDKIDQLWKLAGGMTFGLLFCAAAGGPDEATRARVRSFAFLMAGLLIALAAIETFTGLALNRLAQPAAEYGALERNPGKGVSVLVACVWGAAAGLWLAGRGGWAIALLAGAGFASLQFRMEANAAAFAAGLVAGGVTMLAPRVFLPLSTLGLAGWLAAAPFVLPRLSALPIMDQAPLSWQMRAEIWRFAGERIAEKPLLGWGLDASRTFGETLLERGGLTFRAIPLHPHSGSLQLWLETGAIGVALAAAGLIGLGLALGKALAHARVAAGAAGALIAAAGVIGNVSYGLWQEWWIAAVFIGAGLIAAARPAPTEAA